MSPFSLKEYVEILKIIKATYSTLLLTSKDLLSDEVDGIKKCILRHDIDHSLDHALKIAQLENEHGIQSTYYFLLDTRWYNLLHQEEKRILKEIGDLGHDIGLHYDAGNLIDNRTGWQSDLQWHKSILEDLSGRQVESFSYHRPGAMGLDALDRSERVCGMINCYSLKLNELFVYRSDSLRRFRDPDFISALRLGTYTNLHLLLHPILWQEGENTLDGLIFDSIQANANKLSQEWENVKKVYKVNESN
jgi:hypothetical protein